MHPSDPGASELLGNIGVGYIVLALFVLTLLRLMLAPGRAAAMKSLSELVEALLMAGGLVFLIVRPFLLQAFYIPTESMEPTLHGHSQGVSSDTGQSYPDTIHDHLFVNKLAYRLGSPARGEIVVFRAPKEADAEGGFTREQVLIKRLIALPGDKVEVHGEHVFVNDRELREPYVNPDKNEYNSPSDGWAVGKPLVLAKDQFFVMGDNRDHSMDSRVWGPLERRRIIGKAAVVFWPLSRIGVIR